MSILEEVQKKRDNYMRVLAYDNHPMLDPDLLVLPVDRQYEFFDELTKTTIPSGANWTLAPGVNGCDADDIQYYGMKVLFCLNAQSVLVARS